MNKYMAYNHNGTPLMKQPTTKAKATEELRKYQFATGNGGYVDLA
jgi:hypothetical protein